jgi:uncharacterized protein YdeI (YjbR/CyaY-like superfamily)
MTDRKRPAKSQKKLAPSTRSAKPKADTKPASKTAKASDDYPVLSFERRGQFATWLASNHATAPGIWLRLMKKNSGTDSISYQEALALAIAWGWIDGQLKSFDDRSWLRKFSPRGARSSWSKINRDTALKLIAAGEMHPPGLEQVERAKRDGRWKAAYDSPRNATVPPDLAAALAHSPRAAAFFKTLEARNRYAVLYRVQAPKKAETRARKIRELVAMLERGEKIHP